MTHCPDRDLLERVLNGGVLETELDELDRTAREHLANPNTLIMTVYFLAWGRKPPAKGSGRAARSTSA